MGLDACKLALQQSSFSQAVEETFSGERPCGMCQLIIDLEETENGSNSKPAP